MSHQILSPQQHNAIRRQACAIVRQLGACLESLDDAAETVALHGNHAALTEVVHAHVLTAVDALHALEGHADDLSALIGPIVVRANFAARSSQQGGAK